jgi:hypothetical protein
MTTPNPPIRHRLTPAEAAPAARRPAPALPAPAERPALSVPRLKRRAALRPGVAALLLVKLPFVAQALAVIATPFVAGVNDPLARRVAQASACAEARVLRDAAGAILGIVPARPDAACSGQPFATAVVWATALRMAAAIGSLAGRWSKGPLTLFGHDLRSLTRGAGSMVERALRGIDRRDVRRHTLLPAQGSSPILSAFAARAGEPGAMPRLARKLQFVWASAVSTARHLNDRRSRARFLATRMPVIQTQGGLALAGAIGGEALFGGPPQTLAEEGRGASQDEGSRPCASRLQLPASTPSLW